ncbi:MAG: XRE family transcriptional regulator, partial [Bacteroidota bacterium]
LMDEQELLQDLRSWADSVSWDPEVMRKWLEKYEVTPEMLLQRLSNLLPHHLGLTDLFFLRLQSSPDLEHYRMTKELHLDRLHSPYANALNEHYCRRWVSVNIIKQARQGRSKEVLVDAQLSRYWNSEDVYFCLSMARGQAPASGKFSSVTIGLLVNEQLRESFRFLNDPALPKRLVHTTCERCGIVDCEARARPPLILEEKSSDQELMDSLRALND